MDLYGTIVGTIVYSIAFLWVVCLLFGAPSVFLIIGLPFFIFASITLIVFFICFMFDSWKNFFMIVILLIIILS